MAVRICSVAEGSKAQRAGAREGDVLISIGGNEIRDVLDYQFFISESRVVMTLKRGDRVFHLAMSKDQYEDIGLEFGTYLIDNKKRCKNRCIFCFIDQNPPGMRESIYFKDDDDRLSFLYGNYITLTNLTDEDIERIVMMKISPINISVHTTNPELRASMMGNRSAGSALSRLYRLCSGNIKINTQLVLCPGINDGEELRRTLGDLGGLYPCIGSIACVPVGLTGTGKAYTSFAPSQSGRRPT